MLRRARIVLENCPHHIIQRGHNRQVIFAGDDDYQYYLDNLREWKIEFGCKVYSFCLMTNHVNRLEKRSGSLWEGRYKSSPINDSVDLMPNLVLFAKDSVVTS